MMDFFRIVLSGLILLSCLNLSGQPRTVGLLNTSNRVSDGYVLFSPIFAKETFLIDNCGYLVHKWENNLLPGQSAFITKDGLLLRTQRIPGSLTGGGVGGKMEIADWDGNVLWSYDIANDSMHQHHMALPLEDGSIMAIVWKKYTREAAIDKGFIPSLVPPDGIMSDVIIHFRPSGSDSIQVLWQWDFWDHTIQDINPELKDYGVVSDHPELLDVNFREDPGANPAEWIHMNSIDYDPANDLVLVSSKFHNEIYIIDHSTSTEEARGHSGGKYGKGGDFLFRWGNPRSYGRGTKDDHWLFGQHDVQFIDQGLPGAGHIILFNNGSNRTDSLYSVVEEIIPEINPDDTYKMSPEGRFLPAKPAWNYPQRPDKSFYSSRISGVQRLANGNTLICEGNKGLFREIDVNGQVNWLYRNPVNNLGTAVQGANPPNIDVFTIRKYAPDFAGLDGKDLTPGSPLESQSPDGYCDLINYTTTLSDNSKLSLEPNPAVEILTVRNARKLVGVPSIKYAIHEVTGKILSTGLLPENDQLEISSLRRGYYILTLSGVNTGEMYKFAFIKI